LGVPVGAPLEQLAAEVAARTGCSEPEVAAAMEGPSPPDDAALLRLATSLQDLKEEIDRAR
jgi:hypothetical protein